MDVRFVFLLLLALLLPGCPPPKPPPLTGTGMDMFTPRALRLHPLTRVAAEADKATLEVRLELTDQFGDVTKSPGTATFVLYAAPPLGSRRALDRWQVSLETPQENKAHWDAITRTYLFQRPLSEAARGEKRLELSAEFALRSGQTLTAKLPLGEKAK